MMGVYAMPTMLLLLSARASAFAVRSLQPRGVGARLVHSRRLASSTRLAALQTTLSFDPSTDLRDKATSTLVVGRNSALKSIVDNPDAYVSLFGFRPHPEILSKMHESLHGNAASTSHVLVPTVGPAAPRPPHRMSLVSLKNKVSRNNHPLSLHALSDMVRSNCPSKGTVRVVVCVEDEFPVAPVAAALARAFPLFSKKTSAHGKKKAKEEEDDAKEKEEEEDKERLVHVTFLDSSGKVLKKDAEMQAAEAAAEGVRLACRLVDTHPEQLTTTAYAQECRDLFANDDTVTVEEIVGEELKEKGYGGIYNVGKGAEEPPRLVILTYEPPAEVLSEEDKDTSAITLVGKGIVYDTGGLAIKSRPGMCGMKHDMGGSAGVLGGFMAAVKLRTPRKIRLLLCLAENAIGPASVRNDDIITQYSGKTVEINNSDAEGRLVLSDAVAHATKHFDDCDLVVDMATLTGAQLISTGKMHAGILANTEELEKKAVKAGLSSGDLCYPLLYAPDLLKKEFNSKVADMKNSVKDRSNAQLTKQKQQQKHGPLQPLGLPSPPSGAQSILPMTTQQEDIAAKLLLSSDARIAEAAKRVFSSASAGLPAAAASLAALSSAPASALDGPFEDPAASAQGEEHCGGYAEAAGPLYGGADHSDINGACESASNDEGFEDKEGSEKKPSSTERLKRSRERNRMHARKTRQRKKEHMQKLQNRGDELKLEQIRLKQAISEKNTASILVGLFQNGEGDGSAGHAALDPKVEVLLKRKTEDIPDASKIPELPALILPGQHNGKRKSIDGEEDVEKTASEEQEDGIDYKLLGKDRSSCTAAELDQIRRERNRMHAKRTRDRKRIFMEEMEAMIKELEDENALLQDHMDRLNANQPSSDEGAAAAYFPQAITPELGPQAAPSSSMNATADDANAKGDFLNQIESLLAAAGSFQRKSQCEINAISCAESDVTASHSGRDSYCEEEDSRGSHPNKRQRKSDLHTSVPTSITTTTSISM
ncbi:hypothetical protein ACHAXT_008621 [Thalassiosira profunda]